MENSNTLPKIEVGDTVIFRTDLKVGGMYGVESFEPSMVEFTHKPQIVRAVSDNYFTIENDNWNWAFTSKMVAQVIKPTKERVYSESEMFDFANSYADQIMAGMVKTPKEYFPEYIESLKK